MDFVEVSCEVKGYYWGVCLGLQQRTMFIHFTFFISFFPSFSDSGLFEYGDGGDITDAIWSDEHNLTKMEGLVIGKLDSLLVSSPLYEVCIHGTHSL